jgi:hypothetical protein
MIDRRDMLAGAAVLAAAPLLPAAAQAPPATAPSPTRDERVSKAAAESRMRLDFQRGRFSGPAWDWLLAQGRDSHFLLLGEEHGIAENPKLAAQLFAALVPSGYSKVAVEISPPMAEEIDAALTRGGLAALRRMFASRASNTAFFGMREEAEWLAAARTVLPGGKPFLWGLDYEAFADRHLLAMLKAKRKPAAAADALARLERASHESWAKFEATGDYKYMYTFSGDPALVRAVRAAWPKADPQSVRIIDTLGQTFEINRAWVEKRHWESNRLRASNLRSSFLRHWRAARKEDPRVFFKFGASHLVRGRNTTGTYDLGALLPELAEFEGKRAFSLLILPGPGTQVAGFDPRTFGVTPQKVEGAEYLKGLQPIIAAAHPDAFTLFDTRALRPLLGRAQGADSHLTDFVHGFDSILIMSGSTPSAAL